MAVALRHGMVAHPLSDWRRFACQGHLRLPVEVLPALLSPTHLPVDMPAGSAFVSLAIDPELEEALGDTPCAPEAAAALVLLGIMTVEIGSEVVLGVPGDVALDRGSLGARAARTAVIVAGEPWPRHWSERPWRKGCRS